MKLNEIHEALNKALQSIARIEIDAVKGQKSLDILNELSWVITDCIDELADNIESIRDMGKSLISEINYAMKEVGAD